MQYVLNDIGYDNTATVPSTDSVFCLRCEFWPSQAREWLARKRTYGWPSPKLRKEAENEGCHLVPIGFPGSPTEDMEWRISFSLIERDLIWTWNNTQLKCYVLLKLVLKHGINPLIPDILCTYHMKTLMFWMVEETCPDIWTTALLGVCVQECLRLLLKWLVDGYGPHYFLRYNLFEAKVCGPHRQTLIQAVANFIDDRFSLLHVLGKCKYLPVYYEAIKDGKDDDLDPQHGYFLMRRYHFGFLQYYCQLLAALEADTIL